MEIPVEYKGREQTFLKHSVLREYVTSWGHKMASVGRQRAVRIWYVDCFAGPWNEKGDALADTSVAIGLAALNAAAQTWRGSGARVDVAAVFVEKDVKAYKRLAELVDAQKGLVEASTLHGEFGDHVDTIKRLLGSDPALLFVDPTGWKGAAMKNIAPLMSERYRDVIVNVMVNFIRRFQADPREFLREQLKEFFGLDEGDIPDLDEDHLLKFYRTKLKERCGLSIAADLAIPHPTFNRTWFRLVAGGKSASVLELFRDVERKVVGRQAGTIRQQAQRDRIESRTGQLQLDRLFEAPQTDRIFDELHARDERRIRLDIPKLVASQHGPFPMLFEGLWRDLLQDYHLTRGEVGRIVMDLHRSGEIVLVDMTPRQRLPRNNQIIRLPPPNAVAVLAGRPKR